MNFANDYTLRTQGVNGVTILLERRCSGCLNRNTSDKQMLKGFKRLKRQRY